LHDRRGQASPWFAVELEPEEIDGTALCDAEDEVHDCEKRDDEHGDPDDPRVDFEETDSEEVEAD